MQVRPATVAVALEGDPRILEAATANAFRGRVGLRISSRKLERSWERAVTDLLGQMLTAVSDALLGAEHRLREDDKRLAVGGRLHCRFASRFPIAPRSDGEQVGVDYV